MQKRLDSVRHRRPRMKQHDVASENLNGARQYMQCIVTLHYSPATQGWDDDTSLLKVLWKPMQHLLEEQYVSENMSISDFCCFSSLLSQDFPLASPLIFMDHHCCTASLLIIILRLSECSYKLGIVTKSRVSLSLEFKETRTTAPNDRFRKVNIHVPLTSWSLWGGRHSAGDNCIITFTAQRVPYSCCKFRQE